MLRFELKHFSLLKKNHRKKCLSSLNGCGVISILLAVIARARNGRLESQSTYTVHAKHPSFDWFGVHYVATLTDRCYRLGRTCFRTGRYGPTFAKSTARVCRHMELYTVRNADFSSMSLKRTNRLE